MIDLCFVSASFGVGGTSKSVVAVKEANSPLGMDTKVRGSNVSSSQTDSAPVSYGRLAESTFPMPQQQYEVALSQHGLLPVRTG